MKLYVAEHCADYEYPNFLGLFDSELKAIKRCIEWMDKHGDKNFPCSADVYEAILNKKCYELIFDGRKRVAAISNMSNDSQYPFKGIHIKLWEWTSKEKRFVINRRKEK